MRVFILIKLSFLTYKIFFVIIRGWYFSCSSWTYSTRRSYFQVCAQREYLGRARYSNFFIEHDMMLSVVIFFFQTGHCAHQTRNTQFSLIRDWHWVALMHLVRDNLWIDGRKLCRGEKVPSQNEFSPLQIVFFFCNNFFTSISLWFFSTKTKNAILHEQI